MKEARYVCTLLTFTSELYTRHIQGEVEKGGWGRGGKRMGKRGEERRGEGEGEGRGGSRHHICQIAAAEYAYDGGQ